MYANTSQRCKYLKDLKASDVQDTDEGGPLAFCPVQSLVDAMDQPAEQTLIRGFSQGLHRKVSLETEGKKVL